MIADGVVRAQNRKIIFTTNLPNIGSICRSISMMDISLPPDGGPEPLHQGYFSANPQGRRINNKCGYKMATPENELLLKSNPMRALLDAAALLRFQHFLRHPIKFL